MIKVGNVVSGIGVTLFILSACCLDSLGTFGFIAGIMAVVGIGLTYVGYQIKERSKRYGEK